MRAAVLNAIGDDTLELRDDLTTVDPGTHEIRIRVRATGICHSDLSAMTGSLPALTPGVLGHEGAGEVLEIGSGVDHVAVGDRVIVSFVPPCGYCSACLRNQSHLCSVHTTAAFTSPRFRHGDTPVFGYAGLGTFAEEIVIPAVGAVPVPADLPFDSAALLSCAVLTGAGAVLNTAQVPPGSTVLVIGCGGVGVAAIQGARIAGATTIVAVEPNVAKHASAKEFGATHTTTPEGLATMTEDVTGGEGFDYTVDVVGLAETIRSSWDHARRGGTVVVVGAGRADSMVQFNAQELFLSEKKLLGSFLGSAQVYRDTARMVRLWRAGLLDLESMISRRLTLDDLNDGLQVLREGSSDVTRQVVTVS